MTDRYTSRDKIPYYIDKLNYNLKFREVTLKEKPFRMYQALILISVPLLFLFSDHDNYYYCRNHYYQYHTTGATTTTTAAVINIPAIRLLLKSYYFCCSYYSTSPLVTNFITTTQNPKIVSQIHLQ